MNKNARWLGRLTVLAVAIAVVGLLGAYDFEWRAAAGVGEGYEMMGSVYSGILGTTPDTGPPLSREEAGNIVRSYVFDFYNPQLELAMLMEFDNHFYAQVRELETGRHAFEILIDRFNGRIYPAPGPNMMWSESGHMGSRFWSMDSRSSLELSVTADEAVLTAQEYLDRYSPLLQVDGHAAEFHGYYTLHTLRDGEIVGLLSINGYTGAAWLHDWHGIVLSCLDGELRPHSAVST